MAAPPVGRITLDPPTFSMYIVVHYDRNFRMRGDEPVVTDAPAAGEAAPPVGEAGSAPGPLPVAEPAAEPSILDQSGSLCSALDLFVIALALVALGIIWVFVYRQPIPRGVLRFLGADDTVYRREPTAK
jgi:hypothetical protein